MHKRYTDTQTEIQPYSLSYCSHYRVLRFRRRHPQAGQTYTVEEVAQHNTESDCWIIVDGKVLDVTPFLEQHPGGVEAIENYAGREATDAVLKNISHPDTIEGTAEQFVIGRIAK